MSFPLRLEAAAYGNIGCGDVTSPEPHEALPKPRHDFGNITGSAAQQRLRARIKNCVAVHSIRAIKVGNITALAEMIGSK